jgi:hypothetical protein
MKALSNGFYGCVCDGYVLIPCSLVYLRLSLFHFFECAVFVSCVLLPYTERRRHSQRHGIPTAYRPLQSIPVRVRGSLLHANRLHEHGDASVR